MNNFQGGVYMTRLGVNIDHVATIRQARRAAEPDPVAAAILAELAGADGITVHLRGDRRHIHDGDVRRLRETVTTRLNLEMAATPEMIRIACDLLPDQVTLVPESVDEITTEGGLNVIANPEPVAAAIRALETKQIQVSLFIDPDLEQVNAAADLGALMVELNTRDFSELSLRSPDLGGSRLRQELTRIVQASERGKKKGLRILAGHGLTCRNVHLISAVPEIEELNIGHNIIARASLVGMDRAVRDMLRAMGKNVGL
ncbi:MAG TPA: pyridoxine 5'-phosphate synthase [Acidobacteriota bacterium]|nr:pyridoxine 5'-phosphate synthase [Acidobacteriota bacterium]